MYLHSEELRLIENRARQLRAQALRSFIVSLFSRPATKAAPQMAKTA